MEERNEDARRRVKTLSLSPRWPSPTWPRTWVTFKRATRRLAVEGEMEMDWANAVVIDVSETFIRLCGTVFASCTRKGRRDGRRTRQEYRRQMVRQSLQ